MRKKIRKVSARLVRVVKYPSRTPGELVLIFNTTDNSVPNVIEAKYLFEEKLYEKNCVSLNELNIASTGIPMVITNVDNIHKLHAQADKLKNSEVVIEIITKSNGLTEYHYSVKE